MKQFSSRTFYGRRPARRLPATRWALLAGLLLLLLLARTGRAQGIIVRTVGSGGEFATINEALRNTSGAEAYELQLLDGTFTEDVTITQAFPAGAPLTIKPAAGSTVVWEGTLALEDGAANVTVDGHNGTTARALTLRQPDAARPTLQFAHDAQAITVRDLIIQGSNASSLSGVVVIGSGTTSGHKELHLIGNQIGNVPTGSAPVNLIYAANATAGTLNEQITIRKNELLNFTGTGLAVQAGNGGNWTITENSFYYNLSATPTSAQRAIDFQPGAASDGNSITLNTIGGRTATATGIWDNTGINDFQAIVVSCGSGTGAAANVLSNNTIRNITLSRQNTEQSLTAILVEGGRVELTANVISGLANSGTKGVNSLISRGNVVLSDFAVSSGQIMAVERGTLHVLNNLTNSGILNHTGGNMLVEGNFTNNGTFAQTQGDLEVKGDMTNRNIFNCTTGAVKLTGSRDQKVSGGTYFNLEVNGTGTKTLTGNMTVYNGIQMTQGILNTGAFLISVGPLANVVETDASYILGKVEASGREPEAGKAEDFGNIGLVFTPQFGSVLPGFMTVVRTTGTAVSGQIQRYFDVNADVASGLTASMVIKYLPHEIGTLNMSKLEFLQSTNNGGDWTAEGISNSTTNMAELDKVTSLGRWTLGVFDKPLPVTLTAFSARADGGNAVVSWSTATEIDNHGFGVEVSADGRTFRTLGFVPAAGRGQQYRFVDTEKQKTGVRYYRLRQEDTNGRITHTEARSLAFGPASLTLAAYPNPFAGDLELRLSSPLAATAVLRLVDGLGRTVWTATRALQPGTNQLTAAPACAAGTYVLEATLNGQVLRQRVVRR
ncbi:T9SS type A sorting domain-containing protein [Hymenobacter sp. J193]|uniref:T9SS type A sorting domain-containing protein n=1 Tax=Hymenobacter sp. J193 TaxID=2898429 RepID=UPI00215171A6|nr:T9SS type A sorting domain-containing protein [Hymenobacter sp. J193]MCR5887521.1 T9SS type A sorting domain-containing protein [Hymenobacter sp. J193]